MRWSATPRSSPTTSRSSGRSWDVPRPPRSRGSGWTAVPRSSSRRAWTAVRPARGSSGPPPVPSGTWTSRRSSSHLPARWGETPPNVLIRETVPGHKLLDRVAAVVCHGDHGTVCESLAHGRPLVVAPVRGDQPVIAGRVEAAGAGVRVPCAEAGPDELRGALATVLEDGPHRAAAERVRDAIGSAGGAAEAADRLEKLG
ncbi:glycosyltransferase [Actinomadura madurae]|uniref:glycosyltransferase n=1 Tax=Actinomadura madurae TaxID=1993 RepID=UPI003D6BC207